MLLFAYITGEIHGIRNRLSGAVKSVMFHLHNQSRDGNIVEPSSVYVDRRSATKHNRTQCPP